MKKFLLLILMLFIYSLIGFSQTTVLVEHFDGAWTLPTTLSPAWSGTTTPVDNIWHRSDYTTGWTSPSSGAFSPLGANSTAYSARFHTYEALSGSTGDLISPTINLSTYTTGVNNVDFYYINTSGTDALNVCVSIDGGTTWSTSKLTLGVAASWTKYTVLLGSTSATTMIKFTATSDWGITDIGLDEVLVYNIIPPPVFTYTPLTNTSSLTSRTLTTNITSIVGVPTSGIGLPKLYWKIGSGTYNSVTGVYVSGSTYTFTFGAGVVVGDIVSYYIVAQDISTPTPLVACSPATGATGLTFNPPAAGTPPTTLNTYSIQGTLCGNYNVGVGQTYATITAAIADLNSKELCGPLTFNLLDATYPSETFPLTILANSGSSATNTVTIKPAAGVTSVISSSTATSIFKLNGADYIILDGSNNGTTSQNLTLNLTNTALSAAVWVGSFSSTDGANNNTIKNCIITGSSPTTTTAGILLGSGTTMGNAAEAENSNNTIQNNLITAFQNGIYHSGFVTTLDKNLSITNNTFGSSVAASQLGYRGMILQNAQNFTISKNTITGVVTATTSTSTGIQLGSAFNGGTITLNTISTIKNTNASGYGCNGMYLGSTSTASNVLIANNFISDVAGYGYASSGSGDNGYGMFIYSGGGYNIYYNTISMSTNQTATTGLPAAINISSNVTTANGLNIRNNIFTNSQAIGTQRYAIYSGAANTVYSAIDFNDYFTTGANIGYLGSDRATIAAWRTATGKDVSSISANPMLVSASDLHINTSGSTPPVSNVATPIAAVTNDIDNQGRHLTTPDMGADEFVMTPTIVTNAATLITGTTATINGSVTANNESVAVSFMVDVNPSFATATYYTATPSTVSGNTATPVSYNLTGLIPNTTYYFQAVGTVGYFVSNGVPPLSFTTSAIPPTVVTDAATSVTGTSAILNGTVNANNASTDVTFEYGLTTAYGTIVTASPSPLTGTSNTAVNYSLSGLAANTTYHFRVVGTNAAGTANGNDMSFTTLTVAPLPQYYNYNTNGSNNSFPFNISTGKEVQLLYLPGDFNTPSVSPSGTITSIAFRIGDTYPLGPWDYTDLTIKMGQAASLSSLNAGELYSGPLTTVYYHATSSLSGSAGQWMTIPLDTPFSYDPSKSLIVDIGQCGVPAGTGFSMCFTTLVDNRRNWSTGGCPFTYGGQNSAVYHMGINMIAGSPPTVVTTAATPIGSTTATLNGTVNANNQSSTVTFEYGLTTAYGSSVSGVPGTITGSVVTPVSAAISGLTPATLYHFRAVAVNATGTTLGNDMTFTTVCVTPAAAGPITGPASVCQSTTGVAYSVGAILDASSYVWTVPSGATIATGSGTNSITVDFSGTASSGNISVYGSNGCANGTPSTQALTLNTRPVPVITGSSIGCLGSTGNIYSTASGMSGYTWTISAGGAITAGAGTNTITVTWNTLGAQSISVNYTNAGSCNATTPTVYAVTVNPTSSPTITGTSSLCAGSTGVTYTTQAGFSNYVWTISYDGVITSGLNTNQVTVTWATAGSRYIAVNYANALGCSAVTPTFFPVTVLSVPVPLIFGETTVCQGTTGVVYTTQPTNTGYTWTVSSGGTITAGAGTNAITVTWNTPGAQTVSVNYTNSLVCSAVQPTVYNVTVSPKPAAAGTITGTNPVCAGATGVVYSVPAIANATTYSWTVPAGVTITAGAATNAITVSFGPTAASGIIKVNGENSCGTGASSPNFNLVVNAIPATPVITKVGDTLISSAATGNQWYRNGVLIAGATGKKLIPATLGNYTVVVTLTGCSSLVSNTIIVTSLVGTEPVIGQEFSVYPNPNLGQFNIKAVSGKPVEVSIEIYNNVGSLQWKQEKVTIDGTYLKEIDLRSVPAGVYMVAIRNRDINVVRKVVIMK